jgi:simple sugar transport system ATP-binding protein
MMGREVSELDFKASSREARRRGDTPLLQMRNVSRKRSIQDISVEVFAGETLGLAGLLGSGRTETARVVFGLDHPDTGEIHVDGKPARVGSPLEAICLRFGFCPEDRKVEGIIPNLSIRENIVLAMQSSRGWLRYLRRARQLELADEFIKALNIVTPSPEQSIRLLSGGNQQKVILARWLASRPRLLLLDEPTRGIDVGAKLEIEKLMARLTKEGMAIIVISSDLEELVRSSHRIVVLRDQRKVGELAGAEISESNIMRAIAAHTPEHESVQS